MAVNVEVTQNNNENNMSILRRFTKRVQNAGILHRVRGIRYHDRTHSSYVQKKMRLKSINNKAEIEKQIKLGRMPERRKRRF